MQEMAVATLTTSYTLIIGRLTQEGSGKGMGKVVLADTCRAHKQQGMGQAMLPARLL
jgi:hypothetical protein